MNAAPTVARMFQLGSARAISPLVVFLLTLVVADGTALGIQPGEYLQPFQVKDCTGPASGKTLCYYCRYGLRPAAAVFVREWSDSISDLVVQIDREVESKRDQRLAAFVV